MRPFLARLLLCTTLITACSALNAQPTAGTAGTLKKLAETEVLNLGVRDTQVPFVYLDDNQKYVGYTLDLCMALVDGLRADSGAKTLKVEYKAVTAQTRLALLANGTIDIDCAGVTNNAARQKQVAFSVTHFLAATAFASKKSSNIQKLVDLKGKPVVGIAGTNNIVVLNELNAKHALGMRILPAKDQPEAFLMLATDRAAAVVSDDVLLADSIATAKDPSSYVISQDYMSAFEPYGLVIRRDDPAFKAAVDKALGAFLTSPAGKRNYDKWFVQPIPPRGIKLNLPMSTSLQKAFAKPTDTIEPGAY